MLKDHAEGPVECCKTLQLTKHCSWIRHQMSLMKAYFSFCCTFELKHDTSTPLIHAIKCNFETDIASAALWQQQDRHDIVQGKQLCIVDSLIERYCSFKTTFRLETFEHRGACSENRKCMRNNLTNFQAAFKFCSIEWRWCGHLWQNSKDK